MFLWIVYDFLISVVVGHWNICHHAWCVDSGSSPSTFDTLAYKYTKFLINIYLPYLSEYTNVRIISNIREKYHYKMCRFKSDHAIKGLFWEMKESNVKEKRLKLESYTHPLCCFKYASAIWVLRCNNKLVYYANYLHWIQ